MLGETTSRTDNARPSKSAPAIKVLGSAGGTGVTTILATLARTLSKSGECAVIVEAEPGSVLSYHFGLTERREIQGLQIAPTVGGHPVFLLQRPQINPVENWLEQSLAPLESSRYRILIDGEAAAIDESASFGDMLHLVVLTPDLGSVHRIDGILQELNGQPALFVLNKFDASVTLHEQVREWLAAKIGDRLVTIGRTDAIAESLAEGSTILDYASASPVAADFENLLQVISEWERPATEINTLGVSA
jgi:cellulose biosynthesis protein BcsQ